MASLAFLGVLATQHEYYRDLITHTPEAYVAAAANLAADPERVQWFRTNLRKHYLQGPLGDVQGHARAMEALFESMYNSRLRALQVEAWIYIIAMYLPQLDTKYIQLCARAMKASYNHQCMCVYVTI